MANNPYQYNPYYFDLSQPFLPSISHQEPPQYPQHLPAQYPQNRSFVQTDQQAANHSAQQPEETPRGATNKKPRERWNTEDEQFLVQLWVEHNEQLESKDSRKVWDEIAKTLNEKRKIKKTVDQCQRKIKHLKTLYKERKDWNRRQTGGHIRKSPHYDEFDKVLGCKDIITCKNVEQMGTSTSTSNDGNTSPTSNESDKGTSVESTPSPISASTSAAKKTLTRRKERKRKGRKREDSDSDDDDFKKVVKKMNQEDGQMSRLVDTMQQSQNQQMQLMNQLLTSFNRYMDKKFD